MFWIKKALTGSTVRNTREMGDMNSNSPSQPMEEPPSIFELELPILITVITDLIWKSKYFHFRVQVRVQK